eukprot:1244352-Heterocapsa_arctica.AAC.1
MIISFLTANVFDCQTRLGWIQLFCELETEGRKAEVDMGAFVDAVDHSTSDDLGVKETDPIIPRPPANSEGAEKLPAVVLSDVDMEDMQTGVRKDEPPAPTR